MIELFSALICECIGHPHGQVWTTTNSTSVAVWLPTGVDDGSATHRDILGEVKRVASRIAEVIVWTRLPTVITAAARRPWTGASPAVRTRVGAPPPSLADSGPRTNARTARPKGRTARLETSDVNNVRFYARFGFYVTAELDDLPHHAPTTWIMDRSPQPVLADASGRASERHDG